MRFVNKRQFDPKQHLFRPKCQSGEKLRKAFIFLSDLWQSIAETARQRILAKGSVNKTCTR